MLFILLLFGIFDIFWKCIVDFIGYFHLCVMKIFVTAFTCLFMCINFTHLFSFFLCGHIECYRFCFVLYWMTLN